MTRLSSRKHTAQSFERQYIKSYMSLLTQQVSNVAQKVEDYFFADDGSEDELKTWYYVATALYLAIGLFVFVAIK